MAEPINYKDTRKLVYWHAHRLQRRLYAAGVRGVELDEIVSELNIVWCKARDGYKPEAGAQFHTYLSTCVMHWFSKWKHEQGRRVKTVSIDAEEDDDLSYHEIVADDAEPVDEEMGRRAALAAFLERLPTRAQQYLRLISDPPPEIIAVERALEARAKYARERGYDRFAAKKRLSKLVFEVMGATVTEQNRILGQIHQLIERREKAHA